MRISGRVLSIVSVISVVSGFSDSLTKYGSVLSWPRYSDLTGVFLDFLTEQRGEVAAHLAGEVAAHLAVEVDTWLGEQSIP